VNPLAFVCQVTDELQRRLDLEKSDKECARNVMKQLQELSEVLKAPAESDSSPLLSLPVLSSLETISSQQVTELMSPTCVWAAIREFCQSKFRYDFGHLSWTSAGGLNDKVRLLRNICLKTGIRLVARPWPLDHSETPFTAADILDLKPVVSTSMPISPAAEQMFQDGSSRYDSWLFVYLLYVPSHFNCKNVSQTEKSHPVCQVGHRSN
jgi:hypothetical protein